MWRTLLASHNAACRTVFGQNRFLTGRMYRFFKLWLILPGDHIRGPIPRIFSNRPARPFSERYQPVASIHKASFRVPDAQMFRFALVSDRVKAYIAAIEDCERLCLRATAHARFPFNVDRKPDECLSGEPND